MAQRQQDRMSQQLDAVRGKVENAGRSALERPVFTARIVGLALGVLLLAVGAGTKSANAALCGVLFAGAALIADAKIGAVSGKMFAARVALALVSATLFLFGLSVAWMSVKLQCTPRLMQATGSTLIALTLVMNLVMRYMLA